MLPSPIIISLIACVIILVLIRMQPRRFFLIRHGETLLNHEHIRQGEEGTLSEEGRHQAERVGKALSSLHIKRILSSTYPRAQETAQIVNTYLKVPIVYSKILTERRNPSEIIGKSTHDPDVIRIVDQMDTAYHDDDYRFSDEENFSDEKERARKCLNLLALQSARENVIITHHHFLKMLVAYALYHERLHASDFIKVSFFNVSNNAGITVCEYHPWKMFSKTHGWEVLSFNEIPE